MLTLDFSDAPKDPIERLVWLSGVQAAVDRDLNAEYQRTYYDARQTGRFDTALRLRFHSRKKALAFTRAENERRGRGWKWGDGLST